MENIPIEIMHECGIFLEIYGPEFEKERLESFLMKENNSCAKIDPLLRFFHMAPLSLGAGGLAKKFKLSNEDKQFLCDYEKAVALPMFTDIAGVKRFIYRHGKRVTLAAAVSGGEKIYHCAAEICANWPIPKMPVGGKDLLSLGYKPGPEMGARLDGLEALWLASDFSMSKEQLLAEL